MTAPSSTSTPTSTHAASARPQRYVVLRTEFRLFLREPVPLTWGLALPVAAFAILASIPRLRQPQAALHGASYAQTYQPVILLLAAALLGLSSLPQVIGSYRERGVLRRLSTTPLSPARLLLTQVAIHFAVAVLAAVVVIVLGAAVAGIGPGAEVGGWLIGYLLAALAMLGLGTLLAALVPTAKLASALGSVLFFPLIFGAGLWLPRATMPAALRTVCDWTPLGAANRAMAAAVAGNTPSVAALLVVVLYAVGFTALAVRLFRWQ